MIFRSHKATFLLNIALMTVLAIFLTQRISLADTLTIENWQISADQILEYKEFSSIVATGDVNLIDLESSQRIVEADWLSYDINLQMIKARGNVFLHEAPANIKTPTVVDTAYISTVGSTQSIELIQQKGLTSYQQSSTWLVSYESPLNDQQKNQSEPITKVTTYTPPQPAKQEPLTGAKTYSADQWDIAADELVEIESPAILVAEGNVILRRRIETATDQPAIVYADWLSYDFEQQKIIVRGNVQLEDSSGKHQDTIYEEVILTQKENSETAALNENYTTIDLAGSWIAAFDNDDSSRSVPSAPPSNATSTEEWDIEADRVVRYEDPNSIVAIGNVVLTKRERITEPPKKKTTSSTFNWDDLLGKTTPEPETTIAEAEQKPSPKFKATTKIYADWIAYDVDLEIIKAKGNVMIDNGQETLVAKEGDVEIISETGRFADAIITQQNKFHLEGEMIEKTGYDTYHITNGWVITCKVEDGETPPWSISSSEADMREDGYAVLKHAKFNVKGVPIFYTPYMVIPVKNTRQTGFLLPEASNSSDKGLGINTPFFWNISESTDLTLYPQYFTERGFMPGFEFRYVIDAISKGVVDANFLHDNLDPEETDFNHTNSDRFWLRGKADHTFTNGLIARLDIDVVSDQDFLSEFNSGVTSFKDTQDRYLETFGRGFTNKKDTSRESTLNLLKSFDNSFLQFNLLAVNDVRIDENGDDIETNKPFWKLPNITYSGATPLNFLPATFDWNTDYVYFWREDGYGGHRADLNPSLGANLPISEYLESSVDFGIRNTLYSIDNFGDPVGDDEWTGSSSENRFLYDFELEVATTLEREFNSDNSTNYFEHIIRPFLRYNFLVDEDQEDLPDFDSQDRIDEQNGITYGFDTYLLSFGPDDGNDSKGRQFAFLEMEQTFFLSDINKYNSNGTASTFEDGLSDLSAKLRLYPWTSTFLEYKTEFNMYGEGFVSHNFTGRYRNNRGDSVGMEYSFQDQDDTTDIEQLNGYLNLKLTPEWSFKLDFEHSLVDDETEEANFGITYSQPCWSVTVGSEYTPEDTTFVVYFNLANIGIPIGTGVTKEGL